MYVYLMAVIKAAAKAAQSVEGMTDGQNVFAYNLLRKQIFVDEEARYITRYQHKLLDSYLDRVWNGGEVADNGY